MASTSTPEEKKRDFELAKYLQGRLNIQFWILASEQERADAKAGLNNTKYYRASLCGYAGIKLLNIIRYFPDKTKKTGPNKAYLTINMDRYQTTNNSSVRVIFGEEDKIILRKIMNIENPVDDSNY